MNVKKVAFAIYRYRKNRRSKPFYERFVYEVDPFTTVLDILERIRNERDPSLIFRYSCHHGSCGTCACIINGKERLACVTKVLDLETDAVQIEPLKKMENIGDIAIFPSHLFANISPDWTYIRKCEWNNEASVPEGLREFTRLESCIECGACVSACPVGGSFLGPAALALLNREIENVPEREKDLLSLAGDSNGVWKCERALECSRVCPAGVYPARHIVELRKKIKKTQ